MFSVFPIHWREPPSFSDEQGPAQDICIFFCASAYDELARAALLEERQQFWTSTTLLSQLAPFFRFPS
jgi:hypothetical protein